MAEAVVYTISDCPYCKAAKDDLRRRNVFYREIDVAGDPRARLEMITLSGDNTVPVIILDCSWRLHLLIPQAVEGDC